MDDVSLSLQPLRGLQKDVTLDIHAHFVIESVIQSVIHTSGECLKGYRIAESAYKHGITEAEIDYVLSDLNPTKRMYEIHDDQSGNPQDMVVAHTGTRPWAIEVGICYRNDEDLIFHADKVTPAFEKLYEAEL